MTNPNDATKLKHLDSVLQQINVLSTATGNVDGKLRYELVDGAPVLKMFYGGLEFAFGEPRLCPPSSPVLIGDTIYHGNRQIQLTGFADGLTIYDNTFYAASDTAHESPLGTITPVIRDSAVAEYLIKITDAAALDGDTVSIAQTAGDDVTLYLQLIGAGEYTGGNWGTYEYINDDGDDVTGNAYFTGTGGSGYTKTSDTSYTRSSGTQDDKSYMFQFYRNGTEIDGDANDLLNKDVFTNGYASMEQIRDANGKLTKVVVTVLKDDILYTDSTANTVGTTKVNTLIFRCIGSADGNLGMGVIPTEMKLADNVATSDRGIQNDATFVRNSNNGVYTLTMQEKRPGFIADAWSWDKNSTAIVYSSATDSYKRVKNAGGDFCTIEGLANGLTLSVNEYGMGTISKNGTAVGTVNLDATHSGCGTITITSTDALASDYATKGVKVIDTDYTEGTRAHNKADFKLAFSSTLTDDNAIDTDKPATLTETATNSGTYSFTPSTLKGYFLANTETHPTDAAGTSNDQHYFETSYSYVEERANPNEAGGLIVSGLRTGLGTLTVGFSKDSFGRYDIYNSANLKVGKIDYTNHQITLNDLVLPASPTEGSTVSISGNSAYTLSLDNVIIGGDRAGHIDFDSVGWLSYIGRGRYQGYTRAGDSKSWTYAATAWAESFTIYSLDRHLYGISFTADNSTTDEAHDGTITANKVISAEEYNALEDKSGYQAYGTDYITTSKQNVATVTVREYYVTFTQAEYEFFLNDKNAYEQIDANDATKGYIAKTATQTKPPEGTTYKTVYTITLTPFAFNTSAARTVTFTHNIPDTDFILAMDGADSRFSVDTANNRIIFTPS